MRFLVLLHSFLTVALALIVSARGVNPNGVAKRVTVDSSTPDSTYKYTFDELKPGHSSFQQPYFRFLIFLRMKPGITDAQFHEHWKTVHADLTMSYEHVGVQLRRYVQDKEHRRLVQPLLNTGSLVLAPYDGIGEFHAKDFASFQKFIIHASTDNATLADTKKFVDISSPVQVMAGYDNLIFGSGIRTSGGRHGILPNDRRLKPQVSRRELGMGKWWITLHCEADGAA